MPIAFAVDPGDRIRVASFTGTVTDADLIEAYATLVADPAYRPELNDLADLTLVGRVEVSSEALQRLIGMYAPIDALKVPTRLAIVAPIDLTYGISRMYELLRGDDVPEEVCVFRDLGEARAWLGAA